MDACVSEPRRRGSNGRCGFRDSIENGVNGRLLPRDNPAEWQEALNEAMQVETRKRWAKAGREKIATMDLSPQSHSRRVSEVIEELLTR